MKHKRTPPSWVFSIVFLVLGILVAQAPAVRCATPVKTVIEDWFGLRHFACPTPRTFDPKYREKPSFFAKGTDCPADAHLILVSGQSNAGNFLLSNDYDAKGAVNAYNGKCYDLKGTVLGAVGEKQSLMPAIASKLTLDKPVVFLTTAWPSTSIIHWSKPGSELAHYTNQELKRLQDIGLNVSAMVWIQSEEDAHTGVDYIRRFHMAQNMMFDSITGADDAPLILTQSSLCGRIPTDPDLLAQQEQLGIVALNTDELGDDYRYDTCHYNEKGTEAIATAIAAKLNEALTKSAGDE